MVPMAADRLAEIQARAKKATEGPWELDAQTGPNFYGYLRGEYLQGVGDLDFGEGDQADADREFTINARTDVDWLITEVLQLRAEKAIAERTCEEAATRMNQLRAEVDEYERCFAIPGEEAA